VTKLIICANCGNNTSEPLCTFCNETPVLKAKYRLIRLLGEGGQGAVFFAQDTSNKELAIKRFRLGVGMDSDEWERLEREIQFLRQLNHASIPNYVDHFRATSGPERYLYLVQEYVEGQNLSQLIEKTRYNSKDVMKLVAQISEILLYLHKLTPPVIHRDVKPSNIMLRPDGRIYLIDFGCVRDSAMNTFGATLGVGTFLYMAPEQHHGEVSPAVDIYSLGVTAGHLLSRKPPNTLRPWIRDPSLPKAILSLIDEMLQHDPKKRPSADEVQKRAQEIAFPQKKNIPESKKDQRIQKISKVKKHKRKKELPKGLSRTKKKGFPWLVKLVCGIFILSAIGNLLKDEKISSEPELSFGNTQEEYPKSTAKHTIKEVGFSIPQTADPLSEKEQRMRDILIHDFYQGRMVDRERYDQELDDLCGDAFEPACVWKERKDETSIEDVYQQYTANCISTPDAINCLIAGWGGTQSGSRIIDDKKDTFVDGIEYFKTACNKGNYRACAEHGYILEKSSKHKNYEEAYRLYLDSCKHGSMWGCSRVGWLYDRGYHVTKDSKTSQQYMTFACDRGEGDGCRYIGDVQSDTEKFSWYEKGCEKGSRISCNSSAVAYENATGTEKDQQKATDLYRLACEAKSKFGCYNLAWVYKDARLGEADMEKAWLYFEQACTMQHQESCYNLAKLMFEGAGGKKNIDKGWEVMFNACDNNYYSACHYIGFGYANGKNLKEDGDKALKYYKIACDNETPSSCNNIGTLYYNADIIPVDKLKAYTYFVKACDLKNQMACDNIKMMKNKGDF
jgi:serine/threonine protein kinase/TPR repeat protein